MVVAAVPPPSTSTNGVGGIDGATNKKPKPKSLLAAHQERGGNPSASKSKVVSVPNKEQKGLTAELSEEALSCHKSIDSALTSSIASENFWRNDSAEVEGSSSCLHCHFESSATSPGNTSVFDRLYHNQKRDKPLWKDPKSPQRTNRSVSTKDPASSTSHTAINNTFDRLHKNEKRSDTLWKDPKNRTAIGSDSPIPVKSKDPSAPPSPCFERLYRNEKRAHNKKSSVVPEQSNEDPFTSQRPAVGALRPSMQPVKKSVSVSTSSPLTPKQMSKLSAPAVTPDIQSSTCTPLGALKRDNVLSKMPDSSLLPMEAPKPRCVTPVYSSHTPKPTSSGTTLKTTPSHASFLEDEDCFERLYHNHKRRYPVWKDKPHIIVVKPKGAVTRSLSPHRTLYKPRRTPSIFDRLYHNEKRKEHVWVEPKRSVVNITRSLSPTKHRACTPVIFHRLYHNEKRKEHVWVEPMHTSFSGGSEHHESAKELPEVFDRLYHNQRRSERVWKEATTVHQKTLEKQLSRPEQISRSTHALSSNAAPTDFECDVASGDINQRRGRRKSRSTTQKYTVNSVTTSSGTPVKIAPGSHSLSTEKEQREFPSIHKRSFLACRDQASGEKSPSSNHTILKVYSTSATPNRATDELNIVEEKKNEPANIKSNISVFAASELAHGSPLNRTSEESSFYQPDLQNSPDSWQMPCIVDDKHSSIDHTTHHEFNDALPSSIRKTVARNDVDGTELSTTASSSPIPSSRSVTPKRNNKKTTAIKAIEEETVGAVTGGNVPNAPSRKMSHWSSKAFAFIKSNFASLGDLLITKGVSSTQPDCDICAKEHQAPEDAEVESNNFAANINTFDEVNKATSSNQKPLQPLNVVRPQWGDKIVAAIVDRYLQRMDPGVKLAVDKATVVASDVEIDDVIAVAPIMLSAQIIDWWTVPVNMTPCIPLAAVASHYNYISSTPERHVTSDKWPKKCSFGGGLASTNYSSIFPQPPIAACIGWIFLGHHKENVSLSQI